MTQFSPIIVAFSLPEIAKRELTRLNNNCDKNKGIDFNLHIPHVTLWMGFVEDLKSIEKEFYRVFSSLELEIQIKEQTIFHGVNGDVLSLSLERNRTLEILQNRIHHFFEPFRVHGNQNENLSENTVTYMNDFPNKSCLNYDGHITVGYSSNLAYTTLNKIKVKEPKIFLAGNNCTCLKVIHS